IVCAFCGSGLGLLWLLLHSACGRGSSGASVVEADRVVLNELLQVAVSPARVEIKLLHLRINALVIPAIVIEPINGAHHARAMSSTGAVNVKLAGCRIVDEL